MQNSLRVMLVSVVMVSVSPNNAVAISPQPAKFFPLPPANPSLRVVKPVKQPATKAVLKPADKTNDVSADKLLLSIFAESR